MKDKEQAKFEGWSTLWIWVILAFALLVGAWTTIIVVASKHAPETTPLVESR